MNKPICLQEQVKTLELLLLEKQSSLSKHQSLRIHRALSWLKASLEYQSDLDICFINLWISFSSLLKTASAGQTLQDFSAFIIKQDEEQKIYQFLFEEYANKISVLIKNPFVYPVFWQALQAEQTEQGTDFSNMSWRKSFEQESVAALNALSRRNSAELLDIVLSRLAVLQQQILDGGATWQSRVNRKQLKDAVELLLQLTPLLVDVMIRAEEDWQAVAYPVVDQSLLSSLKA